MIGYGMLSIGAFLEKAGYNIEIFNIPYAYSLGFTEDNILNLFKSYNPKLIGIELNWIQFSKGAIEYAEKLNRPDVLEADRTSESNEMFHIICDEVKREVGGLDSKMIYEKWLNWFKNELKV